MKELEQHVSRMFPPERWVRVRTVVAVSGGPDSVALLRAMIALADPTQTSPASKLIVGHVNHGTRGTESDEDSQFVKQLAMEFGLEYHESVGCDSQSTSKSEESLRDFRYEQLIDLATRLGARYIVTGHHFDDQVETILFRIFRGTGISGLAGIPRQRLANDSVTIVRPLLDLTRDQIVRYLEAIGQDYRTDHSNSDPKYTRNYLRNELLPKLNSRFGNSVSDSIARVGSQAAELNNFLDDLADDLTEAVIEQSGNRLELDCQPLIHCSPVLIRHWLNRIWMDQKWPRQSMTYQWWQKISDAVLQDSDTVLNLPCSFRCEKTGSRVLFTDRRRPLEEADTN